MRQGGLLETKIVVYTEENYRKISKYLTDEKKNFYTYQLKSSKGLMVVVKGIESSVQPEEIKEALEELGYKIKNVVNIFNRDKIPQPMFRVELEPDNRKFKRNETHPIYTLQYLIHRRISVEEPHKRNSPVQCSNCQEFGHTRTYCTLRTVCVVCGELHHSSQCEAIKNGSKKSCSNCGENHTANYRGCKVYKTLLKRLRDRKQNLRGEILESGPMNRNDTFKPVNSGFPTLISEPLNLQQPHVTENKTLKNKPNSAPVNCGVTYAKVVGSDHSQTSFPQNPGGLESLIQTLTQSMVSLNQNMTNFMSSMQNTIQELLRAQNQMLQILLSEK